MSAVENKILKKIETKENSAPDVTPPLLKTTKSKWRPALSLCCLVLARLGLHVDLLLCLFVWLLLWSRSVRFTGAGPAAVELFDPATLKTRS